MPSPLPYIFALLDDCQAQASQPSSRLYTQYMHEHICTDGAQWESVCDAVEKDLQAGLHAVVLAEYEWGVQLHVQKDKDLAHASSRADFSAYGITAEKQKPEDLSSRPSACRFLLFRESTRLSEQEVQAWLEQADATQTATDPLRHKTQNTAAGIAQIESSCSEAEFTQAVNTILEALQAGEMYQMNFTYRLHFDAFGSPLALYRRLRKRQPTAYGACIALPEGNWVLSFSPELFLQNQAGKLTAKPMKGTAARSSAAAHSDAAAQLAASVKNQAENVMIVDLLRNDLSQIAQSGSVQVPALFEVEPYGAVWQMSSTVEAQLRPGLPFAQIMRALFPCGSITGAPKHRSMQWIQALESTPRGLYTGAIGWLDAAPGFTHSASPLACGDFCLSVAIRTLILEKTPTPTYWKGVLGIGSGIVLDSHAEEEFQECRLKAQFLTQLDSAQLNLDFPRAFTLLETMYATREQGIRHARRHMRRLRRAAKHLGFVWLSRPIYRALQAAIAALPAYDGEAAPAAFKIRLTVDALGTYTISTEALPPLPTEPVPISLASDIGLGLENNSPISPPLWLQYKTSFRPHYDHALKNAEAQGVFDLVFVNAKGHLTEGARSNLFLKLDGAWYTPPTSSGALPGVMRAILLADPHFGAKERLLTVDDLYRAEAIVVCNALRGPLNAYLKQIVE